MGVDQFIVTGQAQAIILGIETSCDETAAAVVVRDQSGRGTIRSNVVRSQLDEHAAFGGVVPKNHGLFVTHDTAVNLNSTAGNHSFSYTGVYGTG